jgi:hypothetical protein
MDAPGWKIESGNRAAASRGIEIIVHSAVRQSRRTAPVTARPRLPHPVDMGIIDETIVL